MYYYILLIIKERTLIKNNGTYMQEKVALEKSRNARCVILQ